MNRDMPQYQISITSYHRIDVKKTITIFVNKSRHFHVILDDFKEEKRLLKNQPKLRGCDEKDLTIYSMLMSGTLENVKNLIKTDTPLGVQIDILERIEI